MFFILIESKAVSYTHLPLIYDGELIVGYNYGNIDSYDWGNMAHLKDDWSNIKACMKAGGFTDQELEEYYEKKLNIETLFDIPPADEPISEKTMELEKDITVLSYLITSNHSVIDYEKVLTLGFEGLLKEVEKYYEDTPFYRSVKKVCMAACSLGDKYCLLYTSLFCKYGLFRRYNQRTMRFLEMMRLFCSAF